MISTGCQHQQMQGFTVHNHAVMSHGDRMNVRSDDLIIHIKRGSSEVHAYQFLCKTACQKTRFILRTSCLTVDV